MRVSVHDTTRLVQVQKVLEKSSEQPCEREFMRLVMALPKSEGDGQDPNKADRVQAAQKELDDCMKKAVRSKTLLKLPVHDLPKSVINRPSV